MKNILIKLWIVIVSITLLNSCREDDISGIIKYCNETNTKLSSYKSKTIDLAGLISQNGTLTGYFDKENNLTMVSISTFTDTGRNIASYYFENEKLICAINNEFKYNKPAYMTEELAKKVGDSVWYDDSKTKQYISKYYFYNDKLVKWIDTDGKEVSSKHKKFDYQNAVMYQDGIKLVKMFKEQL